MPAAVPRRQTAGMSGPDAPSRWRLDPAGGIRWEIASDTRLPHEDFLEQGGRRAGQVVWYAIAADRTLTVRRQVVWPGLRVPPNNTHSSLMAAFTGAEVDPLVRIDGRPLGPVTVGSVVLDGTLDIRGRVGALVVRRRTAPAMAEPTVAEEWTLTNAAAIAVEIAVEPQAVLQEVRGPYGVNQVRVTHDAPAVTTLAPGASLTFRQWFSAALANTPRDLPADPFAGRARFVAGIAERLRLETPDPVLDRAFAFAKLRVAEAVNDTRGGPMLAPGGLSYYAATWCNDNVEYAGPFAPFLGEAGGIAAALNAYRHYRPFMGESFTRIPSSIIAEGTSIWEGAGDRGDAAMYAYGCARFCLALGDRAIAEELWPAIAWCLEYCRRRLNAAGVPASDCDELENRLPAGDANLSTASLHYGGLRAAADLARSLGRDAEAAGCDRAADTLAAAIEGHFAAEVEGFATWRYYAGNTVLRSWICLPLCMGLAARREGTIAALFSPRLWTPDGLATQAGERTFWDRSTLSGLRGVIQAGATEAALPRLRAWSARRLLSDHVPYAVEAWPEGRQRQLAAESALYCRIFTEGLFGLLPTGLDRLRCTPRLPAAWPAMALRGLQAGGNRWDLVIARDADGLRVRLTADGHRPHEVTVTEGGSVELVVPPRRS